jgi:hypothetical protein
MPTEILCCPQIHASSANQRRELSLDPRNAEQTGRPPGVKLHQQIHVTVRPGGPFQDRSEQRKAPYVVLPAERRKCSAIGKKTLGHLEFTVFLSRDRPPSLPAGYPAIRTGSEEMPRMKLAYTRFGSSISSTSMPRFRISSHRIPSCISASRFPTQR